MANETEFENGHGEGHGGGRRHRERARECASLPRINEPAPDFRALTTHGERSLSDYRGKWLILFSHPADFTPVCTTEFMAFAKAQDRFAALDTELLGLSIDSHYAHIAWVRSIKQNFGVEIGFPIIADLSMDVARAYGMIQPGASDTAAVRATFIIDPEGVMRAMVYYPNKVATPENWQPGDKVIVPPPATDALAEQRFSEGYETVDWYFSTRDL